MIRLNIRRHLNAESPNSLGVKHVVTLETFDRGLLKVLALMSGETRMLVIRLFADRTRIFPILGVCIQVRFQAVPLGVLFVALIAFVHFGSGVNVNVSAKVISGNESFRTVRTLIPVKQRF